MRPQRGSKDKDDGSTVMIKGSSVKLLTAKFMESDDTFGDVSNNVFNLALTAYIEERLASSKDKDLQD